MCSIRQLHQQAPTRTAIGLMIPRKVVRNKQKQKREPKGRQAGIIILPAWFCSEAPLVGYGYSTASSFSENASTGNRNNLSSSEFLLAQHEFFTYNITEILSTAAAACPWLPHFAFPIPTSIFSLSLYFSLLPWLPTIFVIYPVCHLILLFLSVFPMKS